MRTPRQLVGLLLAGLLVFGLLWLWNPGEFRSIFGAGI